MIKNLKSLNQFHLVSFQLKDPFDDPTFTAKDINTILKEWQKGLKLRNLEYLEIKNVLTFWDHELMADLVYTLSSQNDGRPKKVKFHDKWIYKLPEDNGNAMGEIKQMIEHICEVFRSSICGIDIFEESLIEWVINLQSTIQYVSINDDIIISVQTLNRIFKNLKVTEFFRLGSIKTDQKFEITEPIPSRLVTIYKSYWFTLPAILNAFWKLQIQGKYPKKHRFPLLKLPRVVLLECIEHLDVLEIILFSLLSKRAKTIAKLIRWSPLHIRCLIESLPQIQLRSSTNPGRIWIIKYDDEYNSSEYPYFQSKLTGPKVVHYLLLKDDVGAIEDSKQMTEHICKVFHSPITDIQIGEESVIEWVVKFQPTIRCLLIPESVVISVETLDRILKNIKIKEFLMLGSVAKDKNIQIVEPIPPHSIIVCDSHWITLPSILNGTNSTIRLFGSKLTPMDINTILKEWQMGSKLRNLQYLEIDAVTLEDPHSFADETFQGLNVTRSRDNDGRPTTVKIHDDLIYQLQEAEMVFNLTRSDGMIGSILLWFEADEDPKSIMICFQVWRRQI
ncbi:unnamed protein product [Caenorhabditis nigoni]